MERVACLEMNRPLRKKEGREEKAEKRRVGCQLERKSEEESGQRLISLRSWIWKARLVGAFSKGTSTYLSA